MWDNLRLDYFHLGILKICNTAQSFSSDIKTSRGELNLKRDCVVVFDVAP